MLIELLREAARVVPEQPIVITPDRSWSYASCLARSEELAVGIQSRSLDRFACRIGDVAELVAVLCASTAVGAEACLYPNRADAGQVDSLARLFAHRSVVTDQDLVLAHAEVVGLSTLAATGTLGPSPPGAPTLILTTGTTGVPKGVRHDWARLAAARRQRPEPRGVRWLLAYNLNQFAGVQMLLHVLATQATLVASSGEPRDSLRAMTDHGVTHVSATPTFWRFVIGLLGDQPEARPSLQQITLGGEAIPAHLLVDLRRLFPRAKISQVYAASEFGSGLSVRDDRNGLPASVLERDGSSPVQMKIVDGELHTRSRVGMIGYYDEPDVDQDQWRPTGDLVELRGDRVHFVGRSTDIINVGGVKVHPLPVEERVNALDGVQLARAYGRSNAVTGQLVAVDVVIQPGADVDRVEDAIRAACQSLPPAAQPRRIRFVESVEVIEHKVLRRRPPGE